MSRAGYFYRSLPHFLLLRGVCSCFQISYAIGVAKPLSVMILSYGTSALSEKELLQVVEENFDLRPGVIMRLFDR